MAVTEIKETEKVLIAGIAKPKPFFDYLKNSTDEILEFSDHHHFSANEVELLKAKSKTKLLVTTEKDFVRLQPFAIENLFYLPITSNIINKQEDFNTLILNYVGKSTRNR
jgi:tetraacyldisaccharide 4'-kinase